MKKSFCDKTKKEVHFRINAIRTDAVISAVITIWVWALCKLFSVLIPVEELIFKKIFGVFFGVFCFCPFLVLSTKNLIILVYLKRKHKGNKKPSCKNKKV